MLNDIIKGMAEKIRTVYRPEDYRLYTEDVKQGFKEPCFFISAVEHGHVKCLNTRYKEEYYMSVQYFSERRQCGVRRSFRGTAFFTGIHRSGRRFNTWR